MTGTAIAVLVVLTIAGALVWVARVVVDARRERDALARPLSRRAIDACRTESRNQAPSTVKHQAPSERDRSE